MAAWCDAAKHTWCDQYTGKAYPHAGWRAIEGPIDHVFAVVFIVLAVLVFVGVLVWMWFADDTPVEPAACSMPIVKDSPADWGPH